MKILFTTLILLLSALSSYSQCSLKKTSPFSAIKWENEQPVIMIDGAWLSPDSLDGISIREIILFCKNNYQKDWKKRFTEDFVEVLCKMGNEPKKIISIVWKSKSNELRKTSTKLSKKKREKVMEFTHANPDILEVRSPEKLSSKDAITDALQFRDLLRVSSSYAQLSGLNFESELTEFIEELKGRDSILTFSLARKLGMILGPVGDRHSGVRSEHLISDSKRFLPFIVAPWKEDDVLALTKSPEGYSLLNEEFPRLIAINEIPISEVLQISDYEEVKAPKVARHGRRVSKIRDLVYVFEQNGLEIGDSAVFTFSDFKGQKQKTTTMALSEKRSLWRDVGSCSYNYSSFIDSKSYEGLFKTLDNVGYIALPKMSNKEEHPELFTIMKEKMREMEDTKALILDIRDNGGGRRDLLRLLSTYFLQPDSPSWVANVTKIRVDSTLTTDFDGASSRGLFVYNSPKLTDPDRRAIDQFMESFESKVSYNEPKFSDYYYLVLGPNDSNGSFYYDKPVYVLMNDGSFSAASVFATALKGMNNVKLAGVRTDGSSGMSKTYTLDRSWVRIRISRMISFQRNGFPLDGYGTEPDIPIERDLNQILGKQDTQLERLLEIIRSGE